MASVRLLKNEPGMSPAPCIRCFSSSIPLLFSTEISRDPVTSTLPQNTGRCNPSAWFHCPLSYPRFSEPHSYFTLRLHQDPHLPPLTHESHKSAPGGLNCTSLPSWKLHTPTYADQAPRPSTALYLWVVCVDVETSGVGCAGLALQKAKEEDLEKW